MVGICSGGSLWSCRAPDTLRLAVTVGRTVFIRAPDLDPDPAPTQLKTCARVWGR